MEFIVDARTALFDVQGNRISSSVSLLELTSILFFSNESVSVGAIQLWSDEKRSLFFEKLAIVLSAQSQPTSVFNFDLATRAWALTTVSFLHLVKKIVLFV